MLNREKKVNTTNIAIRTVLIDFISSTTTGLGCSAGLHPFNRASFLALIHNRPYLSAENFKKPFHGFAQTVGQRAICGSIYYFVQNQMRTNIHPILSEKFQISPLEKCLITGFSAGTMYGLINHIPSYIKSYTWSNPHFTFALSMQAILKMNGKIGLARALPDSLRRDALHGITYEIIRHLLRTKYEDIQQQYKLDLNKKFVGFSCDLTAAFIGTAISAPFNYTRSIKFSTSLNLAPLSTFTILNQVWQKAKTQNSMSKFTFLKKQFGVGPGTKQAAAAVALSQGTFNEINAVVRKKFLPEEESQKNTIKPK